MESAYCLSCKTKSVIKDGQKFKVVTKRKREVKMIKFTCQNSTPEKGVCGRIVTTFAKNEVPVVQETPVVEKSVSKSASPKVL